MKTEVYSWRLSPERKRALEDEARRRRVSVSALLDDITGQWLSHRRGKRTVWDGEQARLHAEAEKFIGIIKGGNPYRSQQVRELVRESLIRKYGR